MWSPFYCTFNLSQLAECRQKRVDAEQLLSVEKDTVAAVQHDLQCTKNSLDLAEKRAEKAQVLLRQVNEGTVLTLHVVKCVWMCV